MKASIKRDHGMLKVYIDGKLYVCGVILFFAMQTARRCGGLICSMAGSAVKR